MEGRGGAAGRGFGTRAVHGTRTPRVEEEPASVPIYQTATWGFETSEDFADVLDFRKPGFAYTRGYGNPTIDAFENLMADLEGTEAAVGFASGMAAVHGVVATHAGSGDRIVASRELYGGSYSLFTRVLPRNGVEVTFVDPHDLDAVERGLPGAKLFYVETIANPLVTVADLDALARLCRDAGVPSAVDNTFASPYLCNPVKLGFDHVLHSATKYVSGHHDVIAGVVCTSGVGREALRKTVIDVGGNMQPLEAWLCIRGLVTLKLRMEQHCSNAERVASFLQEHAKVERVHYPGLDSHPQHDLAKRRLRRFGGMLAVEVDGGVEAGNRFADSLELSWIGGSLGGAHTLVSHPASTTHRQYDPAARREAGITDGLIRVSVGLEDAEDILEDFERALEKA